MKIVAIHSFLLVKARAEGAFIDMMKALRRRGHEVDIHVLNISDELREQLKDDFNITSLNFKQSHHRYLDPYLYLINQLKVLRQYKKVSKVINNRYDLAFVDHLYYSPLLLPLLNIPKIYYCYEPPRTYYEPVIIFSNRPKAFRIYRAITFPANVINKHIDRYCVKFADLILCNSDYEREYIWRTYGIFPVTNYLGVDLEKYRKLNLEKENLVVSVGVLSPAKAHDFVIRSIGMIPKDNRPRFVIITAGIAQNKEKERLYKLAAQNNVKLEIKTKYISDEEFAELHSKAKVVAIAYIMDPSIEPVSLAFETPIVAVREAGARETIINGETGILTNRDEKEFAEAIEYLLNHPEVAAEMGRKGREWIEKNFTWEKCAENLERNFDKAISDKYTEFKIHKDIKEYNKSSNTIFEEIYSKKDPWSSISNYNERLRHISSYKLINFKRYDKILDIACGEGIFLNRLSRLSGHLFGLDISFNALSRAKNYTNLNLVQGDIRKIGFKDNSFDLIICLECLYYLPDKDISKTLAEIYRLLRKNSLVLFSAPITGSPFFEYSQFINLVGSRFEIIRIVPISLKIGFRIKFLYKYFLRYSKYLPKRFINQIAILAIKK